MCVPDSYTPSYSSSTMSTASDDQLPTLPPSYTLREGYPPVTDYLHLRKASGLTPKTSAQASAAINGSWSGCFITYEAPKNPSESESDRSTSTASNPVPIAMGRIIGDGGWYFHIVDMAVLPEHQRRGLGDIILKALLKKIWESVPKDDGGKPYITLFADVPGRKLYERNGFVDAMPRSMGMKLY
ncbi:hypothetical protein D9758_008592 [Tetrapyrgos nigripes]|uniref:N-acetyltransferase domain-containing protein n=1 Tax=Tetrapyrgos nigripes TaxID=182062 RepID=A0A8H5G5V1_9AGAR|nr:hypothetical protein D9758_008592 [Tetrapyrgos nigripes]